MSVNPKPGKMEGPGGCDGCTKKCKHKTGTVASGSRTAQVKRPYGCNSGNVK